MLQLFLELQLVDDIIVDSVIFQQDEAPWYYAVIVREYVNSCFSNRRIERGGPRPWPLRSLDFIWLPSGTDALESEGNKQREESEEGKSRRSKEWRSDSIESEQW
ncbi:UNVERIFIED_CONTAM: hypothetical protein RMT77_010694 [Armadillidium vulgare]